MNARIVHGLYKVRILSRAPAHARTAVRNPQLVHAMYACTRAHARIVHGVYKLLILSCVPAHARTAIPKSAPCTRHVRMQARVPLHKIHTLYTPCTDARARTRASYTACTTCGFCRMRQHMRAPLYKPPLPLKKFLIIDAHGWSYINNFMCRSLLQ